MVALNAKLIAKKEENNRLALTFEVNGQPTIFSILDKPYPELETGKFYDIEYIEKPMSNGRGVFRNITRIGEQGKPMTEIKSKFKPRGFSQAKQDNSVLAAATIVAALLEIKDLSKDDVEKSMEYWTEKFRRLSG